MKKIALSYVRVSSPNDPREASLSTQEDAIVKKLESMGFTVPLEYRFRERFTAMESISERPMLNQARELVENGKVTGFGCFDTDRLARDPQGLITVVNSNAKRGCDTVFVNLDHSLSGRIGELLLYMKGFASASEYDHIRERTMRTRTLIAKAGNFYGGGYPRFGYVFDVKTRTRAACPETAPVVREIFRLAADGWSATRIARHLDDQGILSPSARKKELNCRKNPSGGWHVMTICGMLRDRTYLGEVATNKTKVADGRHPGGKRRRIQTPRSEWTILSDPRTEPLIERRVFMAANKTLDHGKTQSRSKRAATSHFLSGHIYCGHCGHRMSAIGGKAATASNHKRHEIYRCTGNNNNRRERSGCVFAISRAKVDGPVWCELIEFVNKDSLLTDALKRLREEAANPQVERDLALSQTMKRKVELRIGRLTDALGDSPGAFTRKTLKEKIAHEEAQLELIDRQIGDLEERLGSVLKIEQHIDRIKSQVKEVRQRLSKNADISVDLKHDAAAWLQARVTVSRTEIKVQVAGIIQDVSTASTGSLHVCTICLIA